MQGFPIMVSTKKTIWQEVKYEKLGFYCSKCCREGHTEVVCRIGEYRRPSGREGNRNKKKVWKEKSSDKDFENGQSSEGK